MREGVEPPDGTDCGEPRDRSQPVHLQLSAGTVADVLYEIARTKIAVLP